MKKETVGGMLDRIQSVCRIGCKVKPVTYIDIETRMLPLEAALAREDWAEVDRQHAELFAGLHRQNQLNYYDDLRQRDRSWLTRKLLTLEARARTLFGH